MKVLAPLGTRPEIVKGAPVVKALRARGAEVHLVATGQHGDPALSSAFFGELALEPDERWTLPDLEADRVGTLLSLAMRSVQEHRPDLVMVVGDTYTVPLFCLAARRFQVAVAHVEAGLRSFNERSLEEFDRLVGMVGATLHFPPTERAASNLMRAGVPAERIHVVGNPVVDALQEWGLTPRPLEARVGVVVTAHRATNVDDPQRLQALVEILVGLAETGPVTFPIQPRTQARLEAADLVGRLRDAGITMLAPVPHRRMLELVAGARLVVTDSGGLQEEAAWFGVPVVVLRHSTPRWEGIIAGTSRLVGLDVGRALEAALELSQPSAQALAARTPCPYGDGHAAERIAEVICDPRAETQWRLREHDFVGKPPPA